MEIILRYVAVGFVSFLIGMIFMFILSSIRCSGLVQKTADLSAENVKLRKELLSYDEICEINEEVK